MNRTLSCAGGNSQEKKPTPLYHVTQLVLGTPPPPPAPVFRQTNSRCVPFITFYIDVYDHRTQLVHRWRHPSGRSAKWLKSRGTQRQRRSDVAWLAAYRSTQGFCCSRDVWGKGGEGAGSGWAGGDIVSALAIVPAVLEPLCHGESRFARRLSCCCISVFAVAVMVSGQAKLMTGDLVRWSLQVNENQVKPLVLLLSSLKLQATVGGVRCDSSVTQARVGTSGMLLTVQRSGVFSFLLCLYSRMWRGGHCNVHL